MSNVRPVSYADKASFQRLAQQADSTGQVFEFSAYLFPDKSTGKTLPIHTVPISLTTIQNHLIRLSNSPNRTLSLLDDGPLPEVVVDEQEIKRIIDHESNLAGGKRQEIMVIVFEEPVGPQQQALPIQSAMGGQPGVGPQESAGQDSSAQGETGKLRHKNREGGMCGCNVM